MRFAAFFFVCISSLAAADLEKSFGGSHVEEVVRIRLDRGDLLLETILDAVKKHDVQDGAVLTAVGSLQECNFHTVKSFAESPEQNPIHKQGPLEILNVNGMIAAGEPHLHMTLADKDGRAVGGHLDPGCKVLYRAEVTIAKYAGTQLERKRNAAGVGVLQER